MDKILGCFINALRCLYSHLVIKVLPYFILPRGYLSKLKWYFKNIAGYIHYLSKYLDRILTTFRGQVTHFDITLSLLTRVLCLNICYQAHRQ